MGNLEIQKWNELLDLNRGILKKLEEVRCGIIDVEVLLEKLVKHNGEPT